jgi:hypothetical protein
MRTLASLCNIAPKATQPRPCLYDQEHLQEQKKPLKSISSMAFPLGGGMEFKTKGKKPILTVLSRQSVVSMLSRVQP